MLTPESTPGWMTYAEAAEATGITVEGIRTRARRENWPKQRPNAPGLPARVKPPPELLLAPAHPLLAPRSPHAVPHDHPPGQTPSIARADPDSDAVALLRDHLADLREALDRADERAASDAATIRFLQSQVERLLTGRQPAPAVPRRRWWRRLTGEG